MDASELTRMRNANAQFCYLKKNVLTKQPTCYSDSCLDLSGCAPIQYDSYAQKYLLKEGARDMGGYTPPIIPTYDNKLGFYVLGNYDGYDNYQYRFYDGWGPLIDSGIRVNTYVIYNSYTGIGYQYAQFTDGSVNMILQILDSTGIIIKTIRYQCISGPDNYYNGPRQGVLYYETPAGVNTFLLIDPYYGTVKTYTTDLIFSGKIGVTGSAVSFILTDCPDCYFYIWPFTASRPYMALKYDTLSYFPYTPPIMDHVAFATQDQSGKYDKVNVLLANGTFLTYTLPITYSDIDISYYGIDNSRLYVIGNDPVDVYLFTLNATDFMNPSIINGIQPPNGYNIIAHVNEDKDYLTAQNNHFGMYIYTDDYAPYIAPFYNATFIGVFENGTSFSNDYTYENFAISDYVGLNSNGFTLLGNSNDDSLISYTIAPTTRYTRVLPTATIDRTSGYIIQYDNLNDYIYFDIYSSESESDTIHRGFIIDSTNNHAPYYKTYANNNRSDIVIVTSGNSLCCTGTQDTRLAYFNPTVGFNIDDTTDIYEGQELSATYPWLGSGVIFSVNSDASYNILTSNTYTPNIHNSFNVINDTLNLYGFSDNINVLGWNGGGLSVYNLDSTGTLTVSPAVTTSWWGIYFQNTPTKAMWAVYTSGSTGGLKYVDYDITTHTYASLNETNTITNLVLRTNNYYTANY